MSTVAILGAGPLGAAIGDALAHRARFREIRIVDAAANVASGKALDIRQSGPIDRFDTAISGTGDVLASVGADVVVLADAIDGGEWTGDRGLGLVGRLLRAGLTAPIVFAGPHQRPLLEAAARELKAPREKLVGSAAAALVGAARALIALDVDGSPADVAVVVTGQPPNFVVAWTSATIAGSPIAERVPAHRQLAITASLRKMWPLGPLAIAAATAPVVEALAFGSRRLHHAAAMLDGEFGIRDAAGILPLSLARGRIAARVPPGLSPQEAVAFVNSFTAKG